ncbi:MAG: DUF2336 domain-containing protein [Alphaproteobacteria bacterium]|nr:DUF2336 domain-containing protein [Alphaproteobacteria bacterium]
MTENKLSEMDVKRLLDNPSGVARANTAAKLAQQFGRGDFTPAQRQMAEQIFRIMVRDAEVRVRQALSVHLKESGLVPRDVANSLARDVEDVALPILQFSDVLTNEDLIEIVRGQGVEKQKAVARRAHVDSDVAAALVDEGNEDVVVTLVTNQGADISELSLQKVVDRFGDSEAIQGPLVHRAKLPITVAERLVATVSERLRDHLLTHHELPPAVAADLVMQTRERATITLSSQSTEDEVQMLVAQLISNNRLTPSIILRAVCMGDMKFFEYSLAELAGVPVVNARILIHDSGDLGLRGIYTKAMLPLEYYPAARAAIDVAHETQYDGEANDRERYSRRIIELVLTQYGELGIQFEKDDLDYLFLKMSQLPGDRL